MRIGSSLPPLPEYRRERGGGQRSPVDLQAEPGTRAPRLGRTGASELAALEQSGSVAPRNRQALQTYFANLPSMGERLGVELAGVDIYV